MNFNFYHMLMHCCNIKPLLLKADNFIYIRKTDLITAFFRLPQGLCIFHTDDMAIFDNADTITCSFNFFKHM